MRARSLFLTVLSGVLLVLVGCPTEADDDVSTDDDAADDDAADDDGGDEDGGDDDGADDDGGDDDGADDDGGDDDSGDDDSGDDDTTPGEVLAFPGAEGFGARATGGRGGQVLKVTTLAASGPGSLQWALDQSGPRIIVFEVSGVIETDIVEITHGDVTIAGQTAPGGGITIEGRLYGDYDFAVGNIIIRHLRIRPPAFNGPDGNQYDAIQLSRNGNTILDHVSVAFGVDETIDLYSAEDMTLQWSSIEMSATEGHPEGEHNYGLISGPDGGRVSIHHNLFVHHKNRCPAIANGPSEVRNNVVYNVRHGFVHHNPATGPFNIVGNYYRDGADDTLIPFYFDDDNGGSDPALAYYLADNFIDDPSSDCQGLVQNPWTECSQDLFLDASHYSATEIDFSALVQDHVPVSTGSPTDAYTEVLLKAGAWPRDVVTTQCGQETQAGTGSWGAQIPGDLMQGLTPTPPPTDADDDGMDDSWESAHGLDPGDGTDHTTVMPSGYTAIEVYINQLADSLTP
jgi:pectate lyase